MKWGILCRWQSWWIGAHWSPYNKRLCVNLIPLVTVWFAAGDGIAPEHGFDIYRSDLVKKAEAEMLKRKFSQTKRISLTDTLDRISQATNECKAHKAQIEDDAKNRLLKQQETAVQNLAISETKSSIVDLLESGFYSEDDLRFLMVVMTGFLSVPPAALFQQLRSVHVPATPGSPPCPPEGNQ